MVFEVLFFTRLLHYYDLPRTLSNSLNIVYYEEIEERPSFFNPLTAGVMDRRTDGRTDRHDKGAPGLQVLKILLKLSSVSTRFSQIKSVIKNNKRM